MFSLLAKERIVAPAGYNRWRIPPAAIAIHLCIGQAYAFSVFNLPLSRLRGIETSTSDDWQLTDIGWIFTLAIVVLGLAAAFGGRWLDRAGPRKSGVVSALCWGLGFFISALGVSVHQIWLLYVGYGIIGGCGLGLGYITPVSTLIRWFPDRRGMATGMAIMGFGGGAMIASPLSQRLMSLFSSSTSLGVAETFLALGTIYTIAMLLAAFAFRIPPANWSPPGWKAPTTAQHNFATTHFAPDEAMHTRAFVLLWFVLFSNVTAGIGVLGQASAMSQEIFAGSIDARAASGFVGLLSLFNLCGRFIWSSASDRIGRKSTYAIFFLLGAVLYACVPMTGRLHSVALFVACFAVIMSMYGGGFATIPAYLSDLFGTRYVGAIHGRLLTAWSAAGIAGPALVNYLRQYQIDQGISSAHAYDLPMYLMAGLMAFGLFCNWGIRRVSESRPTTECSKTELEETTSNVSAPSVRSEDSLEEIHRAQVVDTGYGLMRWFLVAVPLAWGVFMTIQRALLMF